jgi:hypothetical protein
MPYLAGMVVRDSEISPFFRMRNSRIAHPLGIGIHIAPREFGDAGMPVLVFGFSGGFY